MAPGLLSTIRWAFVITVAVIGGALSQPAHAEIPSWYICFAGYSIPGNPGEPMFVGKSGTINQRDYSVIGSPFQGAAGDRDTSESVQTAFQRYKAEADAWAHSLHSGAVRYDPGCEGPFTRADLDARMAQLARNNDAYTSSQNWVPSTAAADFRASSGRASGSSSAGNKPAGVAGSNAATSSSGEHRRYDKGLNKCVHLENNHTIVNSCNVPVFVLWFDEGDFRTVGGAEYAVPANGSVDVPHITGQWMYAACPRLDDIETPGHPGVQWHNPKGPFVCHHFEKQP
jgi:hypothetical protein